MAGDNSIRIVQSLIPTQEQKEAQESHQAEMKAQLLLQAQEEYQSILDQDTLDIISRSFAVSNC